MSGKAIFTISFFILLVIFSVIFDFWGYLIVIGLILLAVMIVWFFRREEHLDLRMPDVDYTPSYRYRPFKGRKLRSRIEEEWDRQSSFGNPEDLR